MQHVLVGTEIRSTARASALAIAPAAFGSRLEPRLRYEERVFLDPSAVADSYHFLLARWLVLRHQMLELRSGLKWNEIVHHPPDPSCAARPNFDVITSDAWIGLNEGSWAVLDLPAIHGRYYTVQLLDGWGEVVTNINERNYPHHSFGRFAFCLKGAQIDLPNDMQRIELPSAQSRMKITIEIGRSLEEAHELQKRIALHLSGQGWVAPKINASELRYARLLDGDCFQAANAIMAGEGIGNAGDSVRQALGIAAAATDPSSQREITRAIQNLAIPALFTKTRRPGELRNGWMRPHKTGRYDGNYLLQSAMHLTDIWANTADEVTSFSQTSLDGNSALYQTFSRGSLPSEAARYGWSVTCVDNERLQPVANVLNRHALSNRAPLDLNADGSLTLCFAPERPERCAEPNWLPTPAGSRYRLIYRLYGPSVTISAGDGYPPPLQQA